MAKRTNLIHQQTWNTKFPKENKQKRSNIPSVKSLTAAADFKATFFSGKVFKPKCVVLAHSIPWHRANSAPASVQHGTVAARSRACGEQEEEAKATNIRRTRIWRKWVSVLKVTQLTTGHYTHTHVSQHTHSAQSHRHCALQLSDSARHTQSWSLSSADRLFTLQATAPPYCHPTTKTIRPIAGIFPFFKRTSFKRGMRDFSQIIEFCKF